VKSIPTPCMRCQDPGSSSLCDECSMESDGLFMLIVEGDLDEEEIASVLADPPPVPEGLGRYIGRQRRREFYEKKYDQELARDALENGAGDYE